jgi:hypothetical protein
MSHQCARLFPQVQVPLVLAVAALLCVAWPADAGDQPCSKPTEIHRGDGLRLLRVYACGYSNDSGVAERGRVVMATYRRDHPMEGWYPVTSQSITLEKAYVEDYTPPKYGRISFGKQHGNDSCRIGSPAGPIGCSVPNTHRVTFYSRAWNRDAGNSLATYVLYVSWRDDQGYPHRLIDLIPIGFPFSPSWEAK